MHSGKQPLEHTAPWANHVTAVGTSYKRSLEGRVLDDLGLKVGLRRARQQLCIKLQPRRHAEAPFISYLAPPHFLCSSHAHSA